MGVRVEMNMWVRVEMNMGYMRDEKNMGDENEEEIRSKKCQGNRGEG